uniref:Uncharacterized protein n=1 Tax=Desertifilum tharense IPPAS B-1220 TaxID=1781255 RepID=A0ACD5GWL8_9CYAN
MGRWGDGGMEVSGGNSTLCSSREDGGMGRWGDGGMEVSGRNSTLCS